MSAFGGAKRENNFQDFTKYVGVMEVIPVAVNPTREELEELLGRTLEKDPEYLGEKDGVKTVRISVYVKDKKTDAINNVSFFLENRTRFNKEETKTQFINSLGQCSWAEDEEGLDDWFTADKDVRKAKVGEEELYNFLRSWLQINFADKDAILSLDFKKLLRGNVDDLRDQIGAGYGMVENKKTKQEEPATICVMAGIKTKEVDGETKSFQVINNKHFCPGWCFKFFQGKRYTEVDAKKIKNTLKNGTKEEKKKIGPSGRFIAGLMDEEYPVKEYIGEYIGVAREYDPADNPISSDEALVEEDNDNSY